MSPSRGNISNPIPTPIILLHRPLGGLWSHHPCVEKGTDQETFWGSFCILWGSKGRLSHDNSRHVGAQRARRCTGSLCVADAGVQNQMGLGAKPGFILKKPVFPTCVIG